MKFLRNRWLLGLIVIVFFILDRLTKYLFTRDISNERCFFIEPIINKGIVFGIPLAASLKTIFFILIIFALLFLMSWLVRSWAAGNKLKIFSLLLILLGAFSNLMDRINIGGVIDFIDLRIWPVFNLADMMIVAGIAFLFLNKADSKK